MSLFWRMAATRALRRSWSRVRHGHRCEPLFMRTVPTGELRVRWEPLLIPKEPGDIDDVYGKPHWRAENPIDRFFPLVEGARDRRLRHTPHVALLAAYQNKGEAPVESDYVRLMRVRARMQGRTRHESFFQAKVDRLVALFDSIKGRGYRGGLAWRQPITVFEHPMTPSSATYEPRNWEIFDGHHRAAALVALDVPEVEVLVLRAVRVEPYNWAIDIPWQENWWDALGRPQAGAIDMREFLP